MLPGALNITQMTLTCLRSKTPMHVAYTKELGHNINALIIIINKYWQGPRMDISDYVTSAFRLFHRSLGPRSQEWNLLKSHITDTLAVHVPSKYIRGKHHLPWLSRDLKKILKRKNKLYFKARITQSTDDWRKYKELKRTAQKQMRKQEWDYVNNISQERESRKERHQMSLEACEIQKTGQHGSVTPKR